jgi:hypothetical protein
LGSIEHRAAVSPQRQIWKRSALNVSLGARVEISGPTRRIYDKGSRGVPGCRSSRQATISRGGDRLQEIFNLDEGSVVLTYPASLSAQSYQDLSDYLELFLRKAKRRAQTDALMPLPDHLKGRTGAGIGDRAGRGFEDADHEE